MIKVPVYDENQNIIVLTDNTFITSRNEDRRKIDITWMDFKQTAMADDFKRTTTYANLNDKRKNLVNALIDAQDA